MRRTELRYIIAEGWTMRRIAWTLILTTFCMAVCLLTLVLFTRSPREAGFVFAGMALQQMLTQWWAAWRRL